MTKSIKLTEPQWSNLKVKLSQDYPPSVLLIREKMQRVLGFVNRHHSDWSGGRYRNFVFLDFYDEPKKTMFALKYSEYMHDRERAV